MKQIDFNAIPEKVESGKLTKEQAVKELAILVEKNWGLFGLQKENPDLRSDILLKLLEKGYVIFESYDSNYGSFFTYFFCYIKNLQHTCRRLQAVRNVREYHNISEYITNYEQKLESYNSINYQDFEPVKVPFTYPKITINDFKVACNSSEYKILPINKASKIDENFNYILNKLHSLRPKVAIKILVVLAMKSAFYINDNQIEKICIICNLDKPSFQDTIQNLKNDLMEKYLTREKILIRRNNAYYLHKKFRSELLWEEYDEMKTGISKKEIAAIYFRHTKNWNRLNNLLNKGINNIRPTNKAVADMLGICERQVSYYLKYAESLNINL